MKKNLVLLFVLIILAAVSGVIFFLSDDENSVTSEVLTDFSIADTSKIDKLFIADTDGNGVNLERNENNVWYVNGKYRTKQEPIDLLLKTFLRVSVKSPVPKTMQESVIKMIAGRGLKVEIFVEGQRNKTYFIGSCTPDHFGTYMVLENAEGVRSSEPMIMHMDGNTGCLRQRFFALEEEWRYTGVFNYEELEFSKVEVMNYEKPEESFAISYKGGNDIKLYSTLLDKDLPVFDTVSVKNYMLLYKKVHIETYNNHLSEEAQDSILKTTPAYTFRVTENSGEVKKIDLFWKNPIKNQRDKDSNPQKWDMDRMYGLYNNEELVLVQRYTFDPLMQSINHFAPRN